MTFENLEKANKLFKDLNDYGKVLEELELLKKDENPTNIQLILEYSQNGKKQVVLPIRQSNELLSFLQEEVQKYRGVIIDEFRAL